MARTSLRNIYLLSLIRCIPIQSTSHTFTVLSLETGIVVLVEIVDVPGFVSEDELKCAFEVSVVPGGSPGFSRIKKRSIMIIPARVPCCNRTCEIPYRNAQPARFPPRLRSERPWQDGLFFQCNYISCF